MTKILRTAMACLGVAASAAAFGACSAATSQTAQVGCVNVSPPPPGTPIYAVVDDLTGVRPAAASRQAAFAAVVQAAFTRHAEVVLIKAGATPAADQIELSALAVPTGPNPTIAAQNQVCAEQEIETAFAGVDKTPASGATDILAALKVVAADLHSYAGHRVDALVMSSAEDSTGAMDLHSSPTLLTQPTTAAAALQHDGALPDLHGWKVAFLVSASTTAQAQALDALWWHVIHDAGAEPVGFQQTVLTWPLTRAAAPQVQGIIGLPAPSNQLRLRLPDKFLFDVNQWTLRPDAAPLIAHVAAILDTQHPTAKAQIYGYASSTGSAGWDLTLSDRRAQTVVSALEADGVAGARLQAIPEGASHFITGIPTSSPQNQRVEITITVPPQPTP